MTDCFQRIVCRNLLNSKAILNKAVRRFPKNLLQKKRRNVYMNLHWKKAAALLLAGVLTAGTLSAFPAAAEDAVPSDTASAPTAAETVPETVPPEEAPVHQLTPPLADFAILNPFSDGELIKSETTGTWQTHNGVDLSCAAGADVFAIDTGTVSKVCSDALWGYTVTIDHDNGVTSRYCGLDGSLEVREGDTVQTGQKIGVTGASPDLESALEPHLHLEVQKSGVYVDPTAYFG